MGSPRRLLIAFLLTLAATSLLSAQPARRVKDINGGGITTPPYGLTRAGNRLFFVADDGRHGYELWTSDGTGAGTTRIPGTSGATQPMASGARVYFMRGYDLWVSDGTPAGTAFVKALSGLPIEWADLTGTLFFSLPSPSFNELWRSDGTEPGTVRVKESDPGDGPRNVQGIVTGNGRVHFIARKSGIDTLWSSDGTPAGTSAVMANPVRVALISPPGLGVLGNVIVFCGVDNDHGFEPWVSDGTDAGTVLLKEIAPGPLYSSSPNEFVRSGARLFFRVLWQIWSTDGTRDGTSFFTSPPLDPVGGTTVAELTDVEARLCFRSTSPFRVWVAGSPDSKVLFTGMAENLTAVGTRLFFTASAGLAVSDLTATGTIGLRSFASPPTSLTAFAGCLYFFADDGVSGPQLWKSDGTTAGTEIVVTIGLGPLGSYPFGFQELAGAAFFLAKSGSPTSELWRTDGTETGTSRSAVTGISDYSGLVATSRKVFWLEGPSGGPSCGGCGTRWLVASDGTQAGTAPIPGPSGSSVYAVGGPVAALDQVFLMGSESLGNVSLWRTDGMAGGTRSLAPFPYGSFGPLCAFHDSVVFLVKPPVGSTDLWRSDGTPQGTVLVKPLSSRSAPECYGPPRRLGRAFVFLADDGSTGCNLWRSDGTPVGTEPLGVVGAGASARMDGLGTSRGIFVFWNDRDVWRTDGTQGGTFLLKHLTFDALILGAEAREGVYLAIRSRGTPEIVEQLWITDGSLAGTVPVHDFKANGENAEIAALTTASGRLLGTLVDAGTGTHSLWTSDGTPSGTVPVQQDVGASGPGFPHRGVTLFAGTDPWAGTEPWAMDGTAFAAPVRPTSLVLVTQCRILDTRLPTRFLGGPALLANGSRVFPVGGVCSIPWTARALAANVTVTGATADGLLKIHPSDIGAPDASVINFHAGQTRANNATLALSGDAEFTVRLNTSAGTGEAHVMVDVVGYYE